jgi:uncharacterized membrane protein YsdA (DUF1294 family)
LIRSSGFEQHRLYSANRNYRRRNQQQQYEQQQQQQQQYESYQESAESSTHAEDPSSMIPPLPVIYLLGGYLVLINAASVAMFWYDKNQAKNGGWRVPEKQLQFTALLGGWVGGMWAMEKFKHKTVKK